MKRINGIRVLVAVCLMKMLCVGFSGAAADHTDRVLAPVYTGITGDITGITGSRAGRTSTTTETRTNTRGAKQWVHGVHGVHGLPFMDDHQHQLPKMEQQVVSHSYSA